MRRVLVAAGLVLGLSGLASAGVINGTFSDGLNGWTKTGAANLVSGDFGMPASPSGNPAVGTVMSWGGDWGGPVGSVSQVVAGVLGPQTLSGELYGGSRGPDTWRDVGVEVLWNGTVVASHFVNGDPSKWAGDFPWTTFNVPVTGTGNDTLLVNFIVHFGEWSWVGADNLQVTPEPASLLLLALGLPLLRRRR